MIDVQSSDDIRIWFPDGETLTILASDIVDLIRRAQQVPVYAPVSSNNACPNEDCNTGWAPDKLKTGELLCPSCFTRWQRDE